MITFLLVLLAFSVGGIFGTWKTLLKLSERGALVKGWQSKVVG